MQLATYLKRTGTKTKDFAKAIGLASCSVSLLVSGKRNPSLGVVYLIHAATRGQVTTEDWKKLYAQKQRRKPRFIKP